MAGRQIFKKLLGVFTGTTGKVFNQFRLMNNFIPIFSTFGSNAYRSSTVRAAIDSIAVNAAKLKPQVVNSKDGKSVPSDKYSYILQYKPNMFMSSYDFYYKLHTQLQNKNNAFVLVDYIDGKLNLLPVNYTSVDALEFEGELFLRFYLLSGEFLTVPYMECIHLRRHFYDQDLYGESNDAILPTLDVINTIDEGLTNAVKSSANLRGILKTTSMMKREDVEYQRRNFIDSFLNQNNNGGIGALDAKLDFQELTGEPKFINPIQADAIKKRVYEYFHVNENIVMSKYSEDEWNAFYESVLEPLGLQMSQEFTHKVLTPKERALGQRIIFTANRLQYASNSSKVTVVKELGALGLLTKDEARGVFNLGPSPDGKGDTMMGSLNYIDTSIQNEYQGGREMDDSSDEAEQNEPADNKDGNDNTGNQSEA